MSERSCIEHMTTLKNAAEAYGALELAECASAALAGDTDPLKRLLRFKVDPGQNTFEFEMRNAKRNAAVHAIYSEFYPNETINCAAKKIESIIKRYRAGTWIRVGEAASTCPHTKRLDQICWGLCRARDGDIGERRIVAILSEFNKRF